MSADEEKDEMDIDDHVLKQSANDDVVPYSIKGDWMGPLYFFPNQCIRETSWSPPHKTSPLIVMIDN